MENEYLGYFLSSRNAKLLFYVSKILFPFCCCYTFPLYLLCLSYKIRKQNLSYSLKETDIFPDTNSEKTIDDNYYVVVNNNYYHQGSTGLLIVSFEDQIIYRYVSITLSDKTSFGVIGVSSVLLFNIKQNLGIVNIENTTVKLKTVSRCKIGFAKEVELAMINSPSDFDNILVDTIWKNYLNECKLLSVSDVIEIPIRQYSGAIQQKEWTHGFKIFFKCKKLIEQNTNGNNFGSYVVYGITTVKQGPNLQSFIPPVCVFNSHEKHKHYNKTPTLYPYGLEKYASLIEKAVIPFISKNCKLWPAFLIIGKKGSAKEMLISNMASKFGMHFYKVTNSDTTAQVYAQNETKLKNIFFNAKLYAPTIIYFKNFENYEKNNEGQTDERIIAHFSSGLKSLFENNVFPVILFCSSNEENISGKLKREFLEVFKIDPLTEEERLMNLRWLTEFYNLKYDSYLEEVAQKTSGFLFNDLKALTQKAIEMHSTNNQAGESLNKYFIKALDCMQNSYNESIGAPKVPKVNWEDIGGLNDAKQEILKTINFSLKHPEILASTGLQRFGILLFGPPGTGKTLLAKAVATECNLCFLSVKGPELLNMYIGQSEGNIREVFERARAASPCIIFFDELDSLAPNRGVSGDSGGVMDRVVSQLLAEMDGINEKSTVFIIGATNRPDLIDPALLRPGRFDKLLYVGPSLDFDSKLSVLKALTRKFNLSPDLNLEQIINICPKNISGADFYGICSNSWSNSVRRIIQRKGKGDDIHKLKPDDVIVQFSDFEDAIKLAKPSITAEDLRYFEKLKQEICSNK